MGSINKVPNAFGDRDLKNVKKDIKEGWGAGILFEGYYVIFAITASFRLYKTTQINEWKRKIS